MAPPTLHPRSRATSTLFTVTLLASFVVVGIPHIFPCPAPRRTLADTDTLSSPDGQGSAANRPKPGRRKGGADVGEMTTRDDEKEMFMQLQREAAQMEKERRECPVPKPRAVIRGLMGFPMPRDVRLDEEQKKR